jgi:hypothetical protein
MRIGDNPINKTGYKVESYIHRIVIPVYIPNEEGYFKDSFEVLKLCINSLQSTIHNLTAITIINNGSCKKVSDYLNNLLQEKKIQSLIVYSINQGKVSPLVAVMKTSSESLITIADADVLFKYGWQSQVEHVFVTYKRVGMVSPLPLPALLKYHSAWSFYFGVKKKCLVRFSESDLESLIKFKQSTNRFNGKLKPIEEQPLGINYKGCKVVIGAGHFCATFSRQAIDSMPLQKPDGKFDSAEEFVFDQSVVKAGLMRLATAQGWVFHIGNTIEDWMPNILSENLKFDKPSISTSLD